MPPRRPGPDQPQGDAQTGQPEEDARKSAHRHTGGYGRQVRRAGHRHRRYLLCSSRFTGPSGGTRHVRTVVAGSLYLAGITYLGFFLLSSFWPFWAVSQASFMLCPSFMVGMEAAAVTGSPYWTATLYSPAWAPSPGLKVSSRKDPESSVTPVAWRPPRDLGMNVTMAPDTGWPSSVTVPLTVCSVSP